MHFSLYQALLLLHALYLTHYAWCDSYTSRMRRWLRRFRVRVDFSTLHPLLLEWWHNFETSTLIAISSESCPIVASVATVLSLIAVLRIIMNQPTALVSRRISDLGVVAICAIVSTRGLVSRLAAHIHAYVVPCKVQLNRQGALLAAMHLLAFYLSKIPLAASCAVFLARDLAHALEKDRRLPTNLTSWGAEYPLKEEDIFPSSLVFTFCPANSDSKLDDLAHLPTQPTDTATNSVLKHEQCLKEPGNCQSS